MQIMRRANATLDVGSLIFLGTLIASFVWGGHEGWKWCLAGLVAGSLNWRYEWSWGDPPSDKET